MDRDQTIMAFLIVLSTIGAIVTAESTIFGSSDSTPQETPAIAPIAAPVGPVSENCGATSTTCSITASASIEKCNRASAAEATRSEMDNPLKSSQCLDADRKLANGCPSGCAADFRTRLVLPSQTRYSLRPPNPDGSCEVEASKTVTFRIGCFN